MDDGVVLVTGASGFAGSHLIELLAGRAELVAWTRSTPDGAQPIPAKWQRVDLLDRDQVRQAIRDLRPTVMYHCAARPTWRNPGATPPRHSRGTSSRRTISWTRLRRVGSRSRVLIPGSATVYSPSTSPIKETSPLAPASPYALSKLAQEQLALRAMREDGLDILATRSFNHTGPRQSPDFFAAGVARQIALIEQGLVDPVIKVGNLDAERDLIDVRDTVRAYELLVEKGEPGTVYNVASGRARPMRVVLQGLVQRSQLPVRIETDAARLRPRDIPVLVGDSTRLRTTTGWSPQISFDRMLDDLLSYWRTVAAGTAGGG